MIEIIATTPEDARIIEACGANRIELVSAFSEGGLTPSWAIIKNVIQAVNIPVNVMIRPHARSFVYSAEELAIMKEDILMAKELGANGVVFGVLTASGNLCIDAVEELLAECDGLEVTFHRAIDELANPVEGIKELSKIPEVTTVLTSGGKGKIEENLSVIREMAEHAGHIHVMAGGGLNLDNIDLVIKETGLKDYHFGTVTRLQRSQFGGIDENSLRQVVSICKKWGL